MKKPKGDTPANLPPCVDTQGDTQGDGGLRISVPLQSNANLAQLSKSSAVVTLDHFLQADGTVKGLSYVSAKANRGAVLQIKLKNASQRRINTTLLVDKRHFPNVYERAIAIVLDFHGIDDRSDIATALQATVDHFIKAKDLRLRRVVEEYDQIEPGSCI